MPLADSLQSLQIRRTVNEFKMAANQTNAEEGEILNKLGANLDAVFLTVTGMVIFLMQFGFAFLEAGSIRAKNTVNVLIKSMLSLLIGGFSYWAVGWAISYGPGGNGFSGATEFFSIGKEYSSYPKWFSQFVIAATVATIVSGAIAERCQLVAYLVYSLLITGCVYPPVSHWAWDCDAPGFLCEWGYNDFAGSGVVHLLGGVCGLIATIMIKPREGRFDDDGTPIEMPGHSLPLAGLGGSIVIFGFLAFNSGGHTAIEGEVTAEIIGQPIVNTVLSGFGGGLTVLLMSKFILRVPWNYLLILNGVLSGIVAICGGCNIYQPWTGIIVGCIGGLAYCGGHSLMLKFKLDDPLDAVAVHGFGGLTGVICVPIFAYEDGVIFKGNTSAPWEKFAINIVGAIVIIIWSSLWAFVIFYVLKLMNLYRIDEETEKHGIDLAGHGESAYPTTETQPKDSSGVPTITLSPTESDNEMAKQVIESDNEMAKQAMGRASSGRRLSQGFSEMKKGLASLASSHSFALTSGSSSAKGGVH